MYMTRFEAMKRIPGSVGLKEGAIAECPADWTLGMAAIGGIDWGPWGEGRRASNEVASSILYLLLGISHEASSTR